MPKITVSLNLLSVFLKCDYNSPWNVRNHPIWSFFSCIIVAFSSFIQSMSQLKSTFDNHFLKDKANYVINIRSTYENSIYQNSTEARKIDAKASITTSFLMLWW